MDNIKSKNVEEVMQNFDRRTKIHMCQQHYRLQQDDSGRMEVFNFKYWFVIKVTGDFKFIIRNAYSPFKFFCTWSKWPNGLTYWLNILRDIIY